MKTIKTLMVSAALTMLAGPALAQTAGQAAAEEASQRAQQNEAEVTERLREAEERLAQAARQIAEISRERLPQMVQVERQYAFSGKPMIGINIDGSKDSGPADGVRVEGITPGGAAEDAGMRAGDTITAINGEDLSAENSLIANEKLFEFMHGIGEDDVLEIDYLRNGNKGTVELSPRINESRSFSMVIPDAPNVHIERIPGAPRAESIFEFRDQFRWINTGLARMELVELNEGLGKYFGTDEGLLVVSAPESEAYMLEDGDVIQSIDGRSPKDVRQALKIFSTYEAGDSVTVGIMRDKRKRELEIRIPEREKQGLLFDFSAPLPALPASAPLPPLPAIPPAADAAVIDIST